MDITLTRLQCRKDGVFGKIESADGLFSCYTLEHAYPMNGQGFKPKVPAGIYICKRRKSPRHKIELFGIMNVPGCSDIEIHVGNFNNDSEGCVLLGDAMEPGPANGIWMIANSLTTFGRFMEFQKDINQFMIVIIDA